MERNYPLYSVLPWSLFALLSIVTSTTLAQKIDPVIWIGDPPPPQLLTTERGDSLIGVVDFITNDSILFLISNDVIISFSRSDVKEVQLYKINPLDTINKNTTSHPPIDKFILSPSGFALEKKAIRYQIINAQLHEIAYAPSSNLSYSLGGYFNSKNTRVFFADLSISGSLHPYVHLKLSTKSLVGTPYQNKGKWIILQPILTFGNEMVNVTASILNYHSMGSWFKETEVASYLSSQVVFGSKFGFLVEVYTHYNSAIFGASQSVGVSLSYHTRKSRLNFGGNLHNPTQPELNPGVFFIALTTMLTPNTR